MRRLWDGFWVWAFGSGVVSALRWMGLYLILVSLGNAYSFLLIDHQSDSRCEIRNEATADAVIIGSESLIEAVEDPDPEAVEAYRTILERNLEAAEVDC